MNSFNDQSNNESDLTLRRFVHFCSLCEDTATELLNAVWLCRSCYEKRKNRMRIAANG